MAFQTSLNDSDQNVSGVSTPAETAPVFRMRVMQSETLEKAPEKGDSSMNTAFVTKKVMTFGILGVLILGLASGIGASYVWSMNQSAPVVANQTADEKAIDNAVKVGAVFGVTDEKTFRDDTEGVLIIGGINGEGSHTLLREGGVSQNVYLTSSVVDLDQFDGMKVRIWGETFKGQKAGWLMDVGRLEVKELSSQKPDWYTKEQAKKAGAATTAKEE